MSDNSISRLKNSREGETAFCIGTAPHLAQLPLEELKDKLTIGCNQLVLDADDYHYDYVCFSDYARFEPLIERVSGLTRIPFLVCADSFENKMRACGAVSFLDRMSFVHNVRTYPGSTDFFSHDLDEGVFYPGTVFGIQIQLAVYLGCKRIYLLGVDAQYDPEDAIYKDIYSETDTRKGNVLIFSHLREWLLRTHGYLRDRGIQIYNAAGDLSKLEGIPKVRFEASVGRPRVVVTSKTFSEHELLVSELRKYIQDVTLNTHSHKLRGVELAKFLAQADAIILGTEKLTRDVIEKLPLLRFVAKYGVGLDNIDFEAIEEAGVELAYRKGTNSDSVAELALCHMLTLLRNLHVSGTAARQKEWKKLPGRELSEVTVGVIGYGHVGSVVCDKLARLRTANILVNDIRDRVVPSPMRLVHIDYLLKQSDVVTIHVSMEPQNYHMVGDRFFAQLKDDAILINTARGDLIDEDALLRALETGKLSACALDVLEDEPNISATLAANERVIISCHQGGSSNRAIENMGWAAIEDLLGLLGMTTE